jgi:hypothetical protein
MLQDALWNMKKKNEKETGSNSNPLPVRKWEPQAFELVCATKKLIRGLSLNIRITDSILRT